MTEDRGLGPDLAERMEEGARLYNAGEFWEAHEAWEEAWLALKEAGDAELADLVQGYILATAAFENLSRGEPNGFSTQGAKALHRLRRLDGRASELGVLDAETFREELLGLYLDVQRLKLEHFDELDRQPPDLDVQAQSE